MPTKKHKPKKARKGPRKGRRSRRRKGLSGTSTAAKMSTKQAFVETGKSTGVGLLGFLASSLAGYGINKISFIQPKETDGKFATIAKKAAKSITLLAVGGTISVIGRKKGSKMIATFGDGFVIGGAFSAVKDLTAGKTQIFSGLGSSNSEMNAALANYYQESIESLKNSLREAGNMKQISGLGDNQEMNGGMGNAFNPGAGLEADRGSMII